MTSNPGRDLVAMRWKEPRCSLDETRRIIQDCGLTDAQLAKTYGVTKSCINAWRHGRTPAPVKIRELEHS